VKIKQLFLALALPALAAAAAAKHDWERIGQVSPSQKVIIHLATGKTVSGTIREVTAEGLTLLRRGRPLELRRADVLEIGRRSRRTAALVGFATGAGIGVALGAAKARDITDRNNPSAQERLGVAAAIGGFFGGIGAGLGAAIGTEVTIYQATPVKKAKSAP
jgi:hypothetical protein